jgi:hypothetical protein
MRTSRRGGRSVRPRRIAAGDRRHARAFAGAALPGRSPRFARARDPASIRLSSYDFALPVRRLPVRTWVAPWRTHGSGAQERSVDAIALDLDLVLDRRRVRAGAAPRRVLERRAVREGRREVPLLPRVALRGVRGERVLRRRARVRRRRVRVRLPSRLRDGGGVLRRPVSPQGDHTLSEVSQNAAVEWRAATLPRESPPDRGLPSRHESCQGAGRLR